MAGSVFNNSLYTFSMDRIQHTVTSIEVGVKTFGRIQGVHTLKQEEHIRLHGVEILFEKFISRG